MIHTWLNMAEHLLEHYIQSWPKKKFLDLSKFRAFADNKLIVTGISRWKDTKHGGKRRKNSKWWLPAFSWFPKKFWETFFFRFTKLRIVRYGVKLLPDDEILDMIKFKAYADGKLNFAKMMISLFDRVENTVRKRENAGYQHFLLFPQRFPMPSSLGSLKVGIAW